MGLQRVLGIACQQHVGDRGREEAAQPAEALDLGHPVGNPLRQGPVEFLKLHRLLPQGEVVLHPRQQDGGADRLGQIVDRAERQALFLAFDFRHGCDKNDRNVMRGRICLEPGADFITAHVRHHDVEQDQVRGRRRLRLFQGLGAAVCGADPVVRLQQFRYQEQVDRVVIYRKDCSAAVGIHLCGHPVIHPQVFY